MDSTPGAQAAAHALSVNRIRLQKPMRSSSIPAGRLFGVEIRIHLSFLLLLFFIGVSQKATHVVINPWRVAALVAIIFGSVVLHELGHALERTNIARNPADWSTFNFFWEKSPTFVEGQGLGGPALANSCFAY